MKIQRHFTEDNQSPYSGINFKKVIIFWYFHSKNTIIDVNNGYIKDISNFLKTKYENKQQNGIMIKNINSFVKKNY